MTTIYVLLGLGLVGIPLLDIFFFRIGLSRGWYVILPMVLGTLLVAFAFALAPNRGMVRTFTSFWVLVPAFMLIFGIGSESDLFVLVSVPIMVILWFSVRNRPAISYLALAACFLVLTVNLIPKNLDRISYSLTTSAILLLTIVLTAWLGRLLAPIGWQKRAERDRLRREQEALLQLPVNR
ncbi:MAG: hypothetical protein WBA28_08085 [Microbacteriaceae bacterium]